MLSLVTNMVVTRIWNGRIMNYFSLSLIKHRVVGVREEAHASVTSAKNDEIQAPVSLSWKYSPVYMA